MRIAQLQTEHCATPSLALVLDGAYYDVGVLEQRWGCPALWCHTDFHARVVSAGCAGLAEIEARLRAGDRPTEARLWPEEVLPLPPCACDRAAYLQLAPYQQSAGVPHHQRRDSRALVGDGQPVAVAAEDGRLGVEAGLAVLLGDELQRASVREAGRAIVGYSLLLDWHATTDPWSVGAQRIEAPSQLGPTLWTGVSIPQLARLRASVIVGEQRYPAGRVGAWRNRPDELLCALSQRTRLCAGDVVGLGCLPGGALPRKGIELDFGDRVCLELAGHGVDEPMRLQGWATRAPDPLPWRQHA